MNPRLANQTGLWLSDLTPVEPTGPDLTPTELTGPDLAPTDPVPNEQS